MSYHYWTFRVVPDARRGEFINVAVIVGSDGKDWAMKTIGSLRGLNAFSTATNEITPWMRDLSRRVSLTNARTFDVDDSNVLSFRWLQQYATRAHNLLQVEPAIPVDALDAQSAADVLGKILLRNEAPTRRSTGRRALVAETRDWYLNVAPLEASQRLLPRADVEVGLHRGRFDFAVVDHSVAQITQAWAFEIKDLARLDQELRAWTYLVDRIRADGGSLLKPDAKSRLSIPDDVPISVVYERPQSPDSYRADLFHAAEADWQRLNLRAVSPDHIDELARDLEVIA